MICTFDRASIAQAHRWRLTKKNPELTGELVDILNSNRKLLTLKLRFNRSGGVVRGGKSGRHHKIFETGWVVTIAVVSQSFVWESYLMYRCRISTRFSAALASRESTLEFLLNT